MRHEEGTTPNKKCYDATIASESETGGDHANGGVSLNVNSSWQTSA